MGVEHGPGRTRGQWLHGGDLQGGERLLLLHTHRDLGHHLFALRLVTHVLGHHRGAAIIAEEPLDVVGCARRVVGWHSQAQMRVSNARPAVWQRDDPEEQGASAFDLTEAHPVRSSSQARCRCVSSGEARCCRRRKAGCRRRRQARSCGGCGGQARGGCRGREATAGLATAATGLGATGSSSRISKSSPIAAGSTHWLCRRGWALGLVVDGRAPCLSGRVS